MAEGIRARIKLPKAAHAGETIIIKTLISHRMENGHRLDAAGKTIPRSIINRFVCAFEGQTVIDIRIEPSVSRNPYFKFEARVLESGTFSFIWYDDDGSIYSESRNIVIT